MVVQVGDTRSSVGVSRGAAEDLRGWSDLHQPDSMAPSQSEFSREKEFIKTAVSTYLDLCTNQSTLVANSETYHWLGRLMTQ